MKNKIKKNTCKLFIKIAKQSVGRSIPANFHEPKIPKCLKDGADSKFYINIH